MAKAERTGKVFSDWSQNAEHKTTVSMYSMRAKHSQPFVSMPISWSEVESALSKGDVESLTFTPQRAINKVKQEGDLFAPVLTMMQTIPEELTRDLGLAAVPHPEPVPVPHPIRDRRAATLAWLIVEEVIGIVKHGFGRRCPERSGGYVYKAENGVRGKRLTFEAPCHCQGQDQSGRLQFEKSAFPRSVKPGAR
ncbi:MAG TPA: hypothetical protein VGM27_29505 [Acidobacteriaceae bacterium]